MRPSHVSFKALRLTKRALSLSAALTAALTFSSYTPTSAQPLMSSLPTTPAPSPVSSLVARRVFTLDIDQDGQDELLRVEGDELSAHKVLNGALGEAVWSVRGPGEAHMVSVGSWGGERRVIVAWGMGVGRLKAPLTLTELRPSTGEQRLLWRYEGDRSQAVHLEVTQPNVASGEVGSAKGEPMIRLAHFTSKYMTRALTLRGGALGALAWSPNSLTELTTGAPPQLIEQVSTTIRMGTSWAYADLEGDGQVEELIGRVYGDTKGEFGELSVRREGQKGQPEVFATERGVKALMWARWGGEARGSLYISDGWVADYGKRARARLKRLSWQQGRPVIEQLASSDNEFTFFELWSRELNGQQLIFARGNSRLSLITPTQEGPWQVTHLAPLSPVVNAAVLYSGGEWWLASPIPKKDIALTKLTHPLLKSAPPQE